MIYFLKRSNGDVKIGTTIRLSVRLKQLADEHGVLELLGVCPGSFAEERALHRKFKDFCVRGEWFDHHESLQDFIEVETVPWDGKDEVRQLLTINVKGTREWQSWVQEVARHFGMTVSEFLDVATRELAKAQGFPEEAPER